MPGAEPRMAPSALQRALRWMLTSRAYDEVALALHRERRIGSYAPAAGQEASIIGSAMALDPGRDWLVPTYREASAMVHHGYTWDRVTAHLMGKVQAAVIPERVRILPVQAGVASQLPHAVGLAWGLKLQERPGAVLVYLGEGASSEGDFHEACNLAGVVNAPVVFWLQDNRWAISTSRAQQSATESFALRAHGYGFEGVSVDGNDLLACYEVAVWAMTRARERQGPTLVEAITYRMAGHDLADEPGRYRDDRTLEGEIRESDPILRVQRFLVSQGMWSQEAQAQATASIQAEIGSAVSIASGLPYPGPDEMFEHVYERPPSRLVEQRRGVLGPPDRPS